MAIPGQKKEREWNDPPIPGDSVNNPLKLTSKEENIINSIKEKIKDVFFIQKTHRHILIAEFCFWIIASLLYKIFISWVELLKITKGLIIEFSPILLFCCYLVGILLNMLLLTFLISYILDWKIPHIKKINSRYKNSTSFKSGYYIGIGLLILILIIVFVLKRGL